MCQHVICYLDVIVVADAPQHVFMSLYTICPGPHAEEAPDDQKLQEAQRWFSGLHSSYVTVADLYSQELYTTLCQNQEQHVRL